MLILLDPKGLGSCPCILESAPPGLGFKIQVFVNHAAGTAGTLEDRQRQWCSKTATESPGTSSVRASHLAAAPWP